MFRALPTKSTLIRSAFRPVQPLHIVPKATMATSKADNADLTAASLFSTAHITAVVTGGGTGIGLMMTQALQTNGARVYITGRRAETLDRVVERYSTGPGTIIALPGDVSSKDEAIRLAAEVERREKERGGDGGIQLLVNNAGIARDDATKYSTNGQPDMTSAEAVSKHFLQSSEEAWAETMRTNVAAAYFMSMAFVPLLARGNARTNPPEGPSSQVINVSSISGVMKGPSGGQPAYAASKAAATQLSRTLATIFKDLRVRVNVIAPGLFPSEMTAGPADADGKNVLDIKPSNPSGRTGRDADMAATLLFLAGRGGAFYNGQVVYPDGGNLLVQPAVAN